MKLIIYVGALLFTVSCGHSQQLGDVPGCPIQFINYLESCYGIFDTPHLKWWEAMSFCTMFGNGEGSLATIESGAEEAFLESQLRVKNGNHTGDFWLGATDMVQENSWVWTRKNEYVREYTNWAPGQPSSGTSENCLALFEGVNFHWNDAPCDYPASFICEVPLRDVPGIVG